MNKYILYLFCNFQSDPFSFKPFCFWPTRSWVLMSWTIHRLGFHNPVQIPGSPLVACYYHSRSTSSHSFYISPHVVLEFSARFDKTRRHHDMTFSVLQSRRPLRLSWPNTLEFASCFSGFSWGHKHSQSFSYFSYKGVSFVFYLKYQEKPFL